METINKLEEASSNLEKEIQRNVEEPDSLILSASITSCKTQLVTLRTDSECQLTKNERSKKEKSRRLADLKRYQSILSELDTWLVTTQTSISSQIEISSVKIIKEQIRSCQVGLFKGSSFF